VPSKKLIAIVTVVSFAVVGGGTAIAISTSAAEAEPLQVTGYADSATTATQLAASEPGLATVAIDGVNLTDDGSGVSRVASADLDLLAQAHASGKRAELLVGNFDDDLGDFSPATASALLESPENIASVVAALTTEADTSGWDGVTVDLESLNRSDAAGLTRFVRALAKSLGPDRTVAVTLMATTGNYGQLGYQLTSLAKAADRLVLMAYDEHGPFSKPGAIGSTAWISKAIAPVLQKVKPGQVELGIAGYGYAWPAEGSTTDVATLSDAQARDRVTADGAKAVWSKAAKEWHAELSDGTTLWWSDKRSYAARYALARQLHLHGVAVWSLSLSDPLEP
jgi:spore germination protein YaaH